MSHYYTRWCEKHGEWDQDIDRPGEECAECVEEGIAPSQLRERELFDLKARLAEAERHLREIADMDWRGNCPPAVMVAKHYWERATASATPRENAGG